MAFVDMINKILKRIPAWPLYIALVLPGVWVFYLAASNQLGADPLKTMERQLGVYALQLLIATLLVTPLRNEFGINLIKYRRAIGVTAFIYVLAHLTTYLWLDQQWWWDAIYKDLTKRPYIIIGMTAFLGLVPLALTSNNLSIRRLGPVAWNKLHRIVYYSALAGATHFVLLRKTWQQEPILYVLIVVTLLLYRLIRANRQRLGDFWRGKGGIWRNESKNRP
jgi:methionine sulfoxide reductase heme-binding subunit